nr:unnamed protein product [Spirometra erinaceieuropaei]
MVYCAKDAQESVKRQQPIVAYRRGRRRVDASKESSEDTLTTTGSTVKSRCPAYVRLSGESQRSTPDSTGFQTSSGTGDLAQPVTRTSSSSSSIQPPTATAAIESRHSLSHSPFATDMADQLVTTAREDSVGNTSSSPRDVDGKPQKYARTSTSLVSLPTCWRKMLANIELFSTIPEPKNISKKQQQHRFMVPWLRGERVPMVVFVTLNVQQMTVSAVLSELNLTATVRNIHGSFTQTNKIRGRSRFKEISSTSSLSGHCDDADICLTEGSGIHILEVACIQMAPSHVLLSCSRSRRLERNACAICVGRVNVTLPHHPVRLHDMVQRQARHLSSTVSEFLQLPTSPAPQSRKSSQKMFSNVNRNASVPRVSNFVTTDGHAAAATVTATYQRHPLVINVSAVTKGLTVSVSLHPSLNAVYEVDPVYFLGQIGPMGFVDITLTKHALSFKSVKLPASFPRAVSIRLPKILTSIAKCQSSGGNCALGPGGERIISQGLTTKEGSYVDIQSTIGTFDQALPSDTLNYIVVVVKLFMKEINEVIRKMAGEQQTWPSVPVTPGTQADNIYQTPPTSKFAVATRFTFRLKLQGIRLQATTPSGAMKLETTEIHVELSNRIGRTHASWCAESSSSSLARAHGLSEARSRTLVDGTSKPTVKTVHPHHEPISYPAAADAVSCAGCESIVLFARLQHLCLELGYLDQDVLYNERAPEFRTLAFFKTSIALRSLLAEEVSAPQRQTASQKLSTSNARRVNEEGSATAPRSAAVPTAGAPSNYLRSAPPTKPPSFFVGGPNSESQRSTAGGAVPFADGSTPTGSSVSGASGSGEQEAFLVSLRRPIIWIKPSAFDRGILIWMVYTREFSKWNEQMRKLNAMSGSVSTPASPPLVFRNHSMVYRPRHINGPLVGSLSPQPTIRSVASTSTASIDNASGSVGSLLKRLPSIASSSMSHEPGPTLPAQTPSVPPRPPVTGPTLFFQLNVEDLGICLPTNILQTSPTSVEVDSRTSVVLTLSRSSLSACLHGSLVSEGEFTDFCLRFDDDFNVGSDDWKPDREKCTIRVRNEEHMVVMNGCVVPSGTSRLCWKALQKLRPDEKARWLVNVQWKMRGLDVHMDHNIGRRLKSLFVTLTTMAGYDGRAPYAQTSTEEETTTVAASAVEATGTGETPSEAQGPPSSSSPSAVEPRRPNTFGAMSMDRLYLGEPLSSDLHNAEAQRQKLEAQYCSSYKRMKWNTLRKRASVLGIPSGRLRRSGSLVASSKERSKGLDHSQLESSSRHVSHKP